MAGSYFMSLMSITLVLFLLGVFALLMMHAQKLSNHLKENIGFEVVMNSNVKESDILKLQKQLDDMPAVKSTEYITKDEAIRRLSEDLGEDFLQWLGNEENPLLPSIEQPQRYRSQPAEKHRYQGNLLPKVARQPHQPKRPPHRHRTDNN